MDRLTIMEALRPEYRSASDLNRLLDHALERARAISGIITLLSQPRTSARIQLQYDFTILQQVRQTFELDIDNPAHIPTPQTMKQYDFVKAVEKFRSKMPPVRQP